VPPKLTMEELLPFDDRALVLWRYDWGDGHVRGVDVMRVRDGKVVEMFAYVKGQHPAPHSVRLFIHPRQRAGRGNALRRLCGAGC
jgi:hypothetical protein